MSALADTEPERDASGQVTTTAKTRPDKLKTGDCVSSLKEGDVKGVQIVPCSSTVEATAEKGCTSRYVASKQQATTPSDVFYIHPIESGWALGDRGVVCLVIPR
ncbi:hypothetical protein F1D05_09090 [Kribbella qitaiheensis]|uniref:Septum formation-related domain-containing protein n=1 Tax=Kribbella qitaiheensis TaxID=1544730 RepID=A0A7G6WVJ6_9ACTN|nr:hypothetical protein [Kribbella qitaiheensis]QNE18011.1 hypothetical protein F1D05_09090 [Kribbella qitaiheensis]